MNSLSLQPVDAVEVITVVDNYTDILMSGHAQVDRHRVFGGKVVGKGMLAEHGLSLLIKVRSKAEAHLLLLDGGWSDIAVPYNLNLLGIRANDLDGIILSHGHMDHFGGLPAALRWLRRQELPFYCHPEVFRTDRYLRFGQDQKTKFPVLTRETLRQNGALLREEHRPQLIADGLLAISGEIARSTDFETGMANAITETSAGTRQDEFKDDQAVIIDVEGKGLVIISGCAHAGIINTILWAQQLTGVQRIFAVLGGFHLSGPAYRKIIGPTMQELERLAPEILVPMHCTGWDTIQLFRQRFPEQFIPSCVGSRFNLAR